MDYAHRRRGAETGGGTLIGLGVWGSGRVELVCGACTWSRRYRADLLIRRLQALGFGGEETLVADVARHVKWPCPACGRMRWGSRAARRAAVDAPWRAARDLGND